MSTMSDPAREAKAVTPNDSTDIAQTRALYIGGAGNVKVDMTGGTSAVTFTGATAGSILPIRCTRVYSTDTTATSIVALY